MLKEQIEFIDKALTHHISYRGKPQSLKGVPRLSLPTGSKYLQVMDFLAMPYSGSQAEKVSKLLREYYIAVGVKTLDEAFDRLYKMFECQDV